MTLLPPKENRKEKKRSEDSIANTSRRNVVPRRKMNVYTHPRLILGNQETLYVTVTTTGTEVFVTEIATEILLVKVLHPSLFGKNMIARRTANWTKKNEGHRIDEEERKI